MDKKQTAEFMKKLVGAYPTFEPTPMRMELWTEMMAEITYDQAIKRLRQYIAVNRFPPSIADILNPDEANRRRQPDTYTQSVHAIINGGFEIYDPTKH
ncbi:MAG: replicative helicase loader/inhibitor [Syntrophomonadaceae bacterium]|jgi:hypothetical protein